MISYILRQIYISIIRCVFGHGSVSKSFNHWFLRYEPVFLGWASCLMLPYSYRWLDCLFNIFSVWHLSKHPSSALQTLYAGNRSTQMASNLEIVMYWHHHGWTGEIRNIGLFGTVGFSKWKPYCHMGSQYIWNKGQQIRIMAVIFVFHRIPH